MERKSWQQQELDIDGHIVSPVRRQRVMKAGAQLFSPLYSAQNPSPGNGIAHTQDEPSLLSESIAGLREALVKRLQIQN